MKQPGKKSAGIRSWKVSGFYRVCYFMALVICMILTEGSICHAEEKTAPDPQELHAKAAVLMDADSGRILYGKNEREVLPMASTTKIMTCILALENGDFDRSVEVSAYAASMPDVQLHIRQGETYRLEDLLYSLMLESHNDTAIAIAEHVSGSVEAFVARMNEKAKQIGCTDTCFVTPNGLDAQEDGRIHSTTAADLAKIMSYCIRTSPQKERFLQITQTPSYQFESSGRTFSCINHNAFLGMMEGALSGKTGFTGKAGYCYVGALKRDERTYVVTLLACGWPNHKTWKWLDTRKLMEYGIAEYSTVDLSKIPLDDAWIKEVPVRDAAGKSLFESVALPVCAEQDKNCPVLMRQDEKPQITCRRSRELQAPVRAGQKIGSICYSLDGNVIWERTLRVQAGIQRRDYPWICRQIFSVYFRTAGCGRSILP